MPDPHQCTKSISLHQIYTSRQNLLQYARSTPVYQIYIAPIYPTPAPDPLYPHLLQYSRCLPVHWVPSYGPDVFPSVSSGKPGLGNLGFSSQAHSFNHLPRIQSQNNSFCCFGNEFSTHANCSLTLNAHVGGGSAFSCLLGEGGGHHRGGFVVVLLADIGSSLPLIDRFTNTI